MSSTSSPATAPPCAFVIFGVTGDLAARKLMPALYALHTKGELDLDTQIVGFSRRDWSDDDLRKEVKEALQEFDKDDFDEGTWEELAPRFTFVQGSYDDGESFEKLSEHLDDLGLSTRIFYTATPPGTYESIARCLAAVGLNESRGGAARLVVEKPFGTDLKSAERLNEIILEHFDEGQVYRIDHYLAKETAQNLAALRFGNTVFEPIWNSQYIDHVQITMAEPIGVEGRGSFYEEAGVIRDVFQNHLLQLVALIATEPPARYDAKSVRDEKVKVFEAMCCVNPAEAVIGQYAANGDAKGYRDEEDVAEKSHQATYAAVEFRIENWRWAGVPFFIRSGKRLAGKTSEIVLQMKRPPHVPFSLEEPLEPDRLILRLAPNEGISLRFNAKAPGGDIDLERVSMNFLYDEEFDRPTPDAYETLILDTMEGDATLFMRADEVEAQWRVIEPLLSYWEGATKEPAFYEAGSWGPAAADELLEDGGRVWHKPGDGETHR